MGSLEYASAQFGPSSPEGGIEMATDSTAMVIPMAKQLRLRNRPMLHFVAGYWALTKPKVNLLIRSEEHTSELQSQ